MANPFRALSVLGAGAVVAGGIAWTSGELQPLGLSSPLVQSAALVDAAPFAAKNELSKLTQKAGDPVNPIEDQPLMLPTRIPAFDIVRVQPDGSMVIAGRAAPGAAIDIIAGDRVIGQTSTDESGSFAFVLDQPLPPGDYTIGLIAKVAGETLKSEETAIVQIPNTPQGDVLAIVTAPETAPEVLAAGAVIAPAQTIVANIETTAPAAAPVSEAAPETVVSANPAVPVAPSASELRIEAVEIDGAKTFIAGTAAAGSMVRLYLGDQLLGEAKAGDTGRFLVETKQPVAIGTQTLRADSVDPQGAVTARASVPFERVDSEKLALVAPAAEPVAPAENAGALTPALDAETSAATITPPLTRVDTSVIIRKGDTLWQIARRVYGKGVTFSTIYNANAAQISDPNRIWPGQVLAVPRATETGQAADFTGIEDQKKEDLIAE